MVTQNEVEEIISLISKGFNLELLSFELDLDIENLKEYEKQLNLRKFAKDSIKSGMVEFAIQELEDFVNNNENNLIERYMLLKIRAYATKTQIDESGLQEIEEAKRKIGFSRDLDEVLNGLNIQIPKRKNSILKKKTKEEIEEEPVEEKIKPEPEVIEKPDYSKVIDRYKSEIEKDPRDALNKRFLLAFTYIKDEKLDEAREELMRLIDEKNSFMAYRILIYLEKNFGSLDDAKLWANEAIDKFPDSIGIREQLMSIAKKENNTEEVLTQLKAILKINPRKEKYKDQFKTELKMLER